MIRRRLRTRSRKPERGGRQKRMPTPSRCERALERRSPGGLRPRTGVTAGREDRALCREKGPEGEPVEVRRTATGRPKRRRLRESTGTDPARDRRERSRARASKRSLRGGAHRRLASRVRTRVLRMRGARSHAPEERSGAGHDEVNVKRATDAERHCGSAKGEGPEGWNPKGGSGMKQARERTRDRQGAERVRNPGRGRR